MVLFVVVFHAAMPYVIDFGAFWPYKDANPSFVLDILVAFIDVFNMAILFYISGYFALPSIRKGVKRFAKSKIISLGIPWLLGITFVVPFLDYIFYRNLIPNGIGFFEYWNLSLLSIAKLNVGFLNQNEFVFMIDQFYQRYMWYLSLLLLFFIFFGVIYLFNKERFERLEAKKASKPTKKFLVLFGSAIAILYFLMDFLTQGNGRTFFTLGNIIQFQPSKLMLYAGFFAIGVYSFSSKWFNDKKPIGNWIIASILLFIITPLFGRFYFRAEEPYLLFQFGFAMVYCFFALSLLIVFTSFSINRWNNPSKSHQEFATNAYNIYLLHYIPVNLLPLALGSWMIPAEIKWIIVSILSVVISYALSQYLAKPILRRIWKR